MAYTLPVDKMIVVQVSYVDSAGNPAAIDGLVGWSSSNSSIAAIAPDTGDSSICSIIPQGTLGSSQITATADADLGDGVKPLITTMDLTVVAGEAVAGTINVVADPQPIAPHAEPQA